MPPLSPAKRAPKRQFSRIFKNCMKKPLQAVKGCVISNITDRSRQPLLVGRRAVAQPTFSAYRREGSPLAAWHSCRPVGVSFAPRVACTNSPCGLRPLPDGFERLATCAQTDKAGGWRLCRPTGRGGRYALPPERKRRRLCAKPLQRAPFLLKSPMNPRARRAA